ncbi:hypothetical protein T11_4180 [Trichinella zimbabwensis]|uniref:Uncharacterized protein n=1 Tax=Trichinella zimbabwensis TaxID=268475 RepID=A0A0V1GBE0_9BILA|nr:hypothetical protein T11_4180 [Trichinella zimbabwensis]
MCIHLFKRANACDLAKKMNLAATGKPTTTRKHV